jgi:2,3-bisphosphoglycerate-independent phosphoglycerate mutase
MIDDQTRSLAEAVRAAYRAGEDDEMIEPLVRVDEEGQPVGRIGDGDYVIFYDIRGEREIELTEAFVADEGDFPHFERAPIQTHWVTMIEYHPDLDARVAFPPSGPIPMTLSETVSDAGKRQVKIVESEKQVHVTTFLNGGRLDPFPGETWEIIESLEADGYLPPPEMRASDVADAAIEALQGESVDLAVVNWANVDVIGHSEEREAIKRAVSTVDAQLGRVLEVARRMGVTALVTADHGTVEKWYYPDGSIDTGHTDSPVPFVLVAPDADPESEARARLHVRSDGTLIDVAPTVLGLMGIKKPDEMGGASLVDGLDGGESRRVALFILDGWGARDEARGNLIVEADTPVMDELQTAYPTTKLEAAGEAVGLPDEVPNREGKTVGNSEVGHTHIGAGRVVTSDRLSIERAIEDGSFFENEALRWAMEGAKEEGARLHLLGIISFYSSHGSVEHLKALLRMAQEVGVPEVYIHGMLGRRGEKPESGAIYVGDIETECERLGVGEFVSLIGRFWSLDREYNWDRIEKSYRWLVYGEGRPVSQG